MKTCSYCAESIEDEAIKCKHCHEFLKVVKPPPIPRGHDLPWHFRPMVVVLALLSAGPLALPMVWWHPRMKWPMKALISILVVVLTWLCVEAIIWWVRCLLEQWPQLQPR